MDLRSPETHIFMVGCFSFFMMVYAVWMGQMTTKPLPGGYTNPVLALELVEKGSHIKEIKDATDIASRNAGQFILQQLQKDIGFIILYVALFSALSLLLLPKSKLAAYAGVGCAVVAGVFDFIENRGMFNALSAERLSDDLASSIRYPSLAKWALIYIVSILIGAFFLSGHKLFSFHSLSFAWLLVLSGLIGLTGVVQNLIKPQFYKAFEVAIIFGVLSIVGIAFLFTFASGLVVKDLYPK